MTPPTQTSLFGLTDKCRWCITLKQFLFLRQYEVKFCLTSVLVRTGCRIWGHVRVRTQWLYEVRLRPIFSTCQTFVLLRENNYNKQFQSLKQSLSQGQDSLIRYTHVNPLFDTVWGPIWASLIKTCFNPFNVFSGLHANWNLINYNVLHVSFLQQSSTCNITCTSTLARSLTLTQRSTCSITVNWLLMWFQRKSFCIHAHTLLLHY